MDWLKRYQPLIIAVTGSASRSTTAAAIEAVVAVSYSTRRSAPALVDPVALALAIIGSHHNPDSVTWYKALTSSFAQEITDEEPAVLILDLPADRPGDLDWVARRIAPDITVVTDVGTANLELFVAKENIAHEMSSLVAMTKASGTVIVNNDDELASAMPTLSHAATISFGTTPAADVRLTRANRLPAGGFAIEVRTHQEIAEVQVPQLIARYQLLCFTAAFAVGHALKIPLARAAQVLHTFAPLPGRMTLLPGRNNSRLIDDSAGATPESIKMALETLRALPSRRRIAILGDIGQLSSEAERVHRAIGRMAAHIAPMVIVVGLHMRWAGMEALQLGADVHHFESAADAGKWLADFIAPEDLVLVSGGREMKMNVIVERLKRT